MLSHPDIKLSPLDPAPAPPSPSSTADSGVFCTHCIAAYAAAITDRIAAGDLAVAVTLRPGDQGSLLFSIRTMRERLAAIVAEVRSGTELVERAAAAGALQEQAAKLAQAVSVFKLAGRAAPPLKLSA